jgi:ribosomal protein S6
MPIKLNSYVVKLTDQQVYLILYLYYEKNVLPHITPTFNVTKAIIRNIVTESLDQFVMRNNPIP